jgi:hypothetical protein
MANLTLNSGTIKYPAGKEFPNKHTDSPNRINIVVTLANGEEATVWGDAGSSLMLYKTGSQSNWLSMAKTTKLWKNRRLSLSHSLPPKRLKLQKRHGTRRWSFVLHVIARRSFRQRLLLITSWA